MKFFFTAILTLGLFAVTACDHPAFPTDGGAEKGPFPYKLIAKSGDDPADNGPDNSTELDEMPGEAGVVKFPHATHASNKGFRIPCNRCHHATADGEDPEQGCTADGCHGIPGEEMDPAHGGPDDNMVLSGGRSDIKAVPFNHFTHASQNGYKQSCASCHHTGTVSACGTCHKALPTVGPEGQVVPKIKRALHAQCIGCHGALKKNQPDTKAPTDCEGCHQARTFETPENPDGGLTRNRAFHLQCIGCHEALQKAGAGKKAPVARCVGCHAESHGESEPSFAELAGEMLAEQAAPKEPEFVRDPALEENKGPESIFIDHAKKAKSGTQFPHHLHQELGDDCYTCHHKGLQDPTCRSCHTDPENAKKAYHANCITCHKENSIPATCKDCHPE